MNEENAVALLLALFCGILGYRSGFFSRVGSAINGSLTVGGR